MLVIGITNKLPFGLRLFMYEYDDIEEFDALEDANFLSQVFNIDIYVLESSKGHYHLVSFDIMPLETVNQIQEWTFLEGNYLTISEMPLYDDKGLWNTLRIGNKGNKPRPRFIAVFYSKIPRYKSIQHYGFYRFYCNIPEPPQDQKLFFTNLKYMMLAVYNTGIGAKRRLKPLFKGVIN